MATAVPNHPSASSTLCESKQSAANAQHSSPAGADPPILARTMGSNEHKIYALLAGSLPQKRREADSRLCASIAMDQHSAKDPEMQLPPLVGRGAVMRRRPPDCARQFPAVQRSNLKVTKNALRAAPRQRRIGITCGMERALASSSGSFPRRTRPYKRPGLRTTAGTELN